ncbi:MAG: hypothetical protein KIS67_26765 [Verrucomicrobiae bacterium]|nr:hypothetical protein [Verrucomicrobiae bacterium]
MKAVSVHVSLNPELAEFAKNDSRSGAFDSVGDYVRDLIRRRREEQIAADVALLQSAIQDAPAGDPAESEFREIYRSAKASRRRR